MCWTPGRHYYIREDPTAIHRQHESASQKMTKSCGPAPRAISSPPHGRLRKHPLHRLLASVLLLAMMQILLTMCQWMTPAQGNLMLDPPMKPTPLVPECTVTSHPHGCAVSTLHRVMLSLSQVNALCVWSSTEYVSGQVVCSTCGYEPLPMDESGRTKRQANRRTKVLERRMQKLAEFGMYGSTLLASHPHR